MFCNNNIEDLERKVKEFLDLCFETKRELLDSWNSGISPKSEEKFVSENQDEFFRAGRSSQ